MVIREWLSRCPLIAILRGIETFDVENVLLELLLVGIVIAEIPLNSPEPFASIRRATDLFGDRMLIGAGTVTKSSDVEEACRAGAKLIVSPNADPKIVRETKRLNLISLPGIATATEAFAMVHAGADALKLFPADVLGPRMLTGLRAVLPNETLIVPVGGVDEETIPAWIDAGANGLGVGSFLYKPGTSRDGVGAKARRLLGCLNETQPVT